MNNLESKGYLTKQKIGLVNFYRPTHKRDGIISKETSRFVKKVFGGSFLDLANYLISSDSLTPEEIEDLKNLIDQKEEETKP